MSEQDYGRPPSDAFFTVRDPEQARLLSDLQSFTYLEPFIARTQTVKGAAEAVGCKLDTMLYRVKTFLRAGLLKVERVEKRAGRPIKHYRSAHDAYLIPFEVTPFASLEERFVELWRSREALLMRPAASMLRSWEYEGQRVYRGGDGTVWRDSAPNSGGESRSDVFQHLDDEAHLQNHVARFGHTIGSDFSTELKLTDEEARALMLELYRVWGKFQQNDQKVATRKPYYLTVTFLPLES